jgi:hypothetical protein
VVVEGDLGAAKRNSHHTTTNVAVRDRVKASSHDWCAAAG